MKTRNRFKLISHSLCPYVQRAVITLKEKGVDFERVDIDLANKPEWFIKLSPLGKVPILVIDDKDVLFESNVITEYLNEVTKGNLHSPSPLTKAKHRAWIEFGSSVLNDIAGLYNAKDANLFQNKASTIRLKLETIEQFFVSEHSADENNKQEGSGYFSGESFLLIDAVYGPIFRYFDVFEMYSELRLFEGLEYVKSWRSALKRRLSVTHAVSLDYADLLRIFVKKRESYLASIMV